MREKISAYVAAYNSEKSIQQVLESIKRQRLPIDEILVIDDGSTDRTAEFAASAGARVIRFEKNLGRGAARARAFEELRNEWVLGLDATSLVDSDFAAKAVRWMQEPSVAAVCSRVVHPNPSGAVARWRARHLFKQDLKFDVRRRASLATGACMLSRCSVLRVGNFNPRLAEGEDAELGQRLLDAQYDVIFDPDLVMISTAQNGLCGTYERYWRWGNAGRPRLNVTGYLRQIWYSLRAMVPTDLRAGDPMAALISLLWPHWGFMLDIRAALVRPGVKRPG